MRPKKAQKTGGEPRRTKPATPDHRSKPTDSAATSALGDALIQQSKGSSLDQALTRALKAASGLTPEGRRHVVLSLYGANRHRARLNWHVEQAGAELTPQALLSAWLAFSQRGQTWSDASGLEDLKLMRQIAKRELHDPAMPEATRLECPAHFEKLLRDALGSNFAAEMTAALEAPPVDLRVNTLKATRAEAIKRLHWDKIEASASPLSPWGLRCAPNANVSATRAFQEGLVEFQDEASQLAALLCDAKPGMQVMDFCSGTGGKTLALGAMMKNKGHIVASDVSDVRLARAKLRLKRAGVENAERIKLPPEDNKSMKRFHGKFHRVLVDAPCSGTGSWRRNPDVRWSVHASNIGELTALQARILERAARYVQPGGHVIYATCSLLPAENSQQVDSFLKAHPDFELVDARDTWSAATDKPWPSGTSKTLQLTPAQHGTDGFFAAILRKATIQA